jgi:alpha-amylase
MVVVMLRNTIFALCLLQLSTVTLAATTTDWASRNIYFVLTDRIARSSTDTGGSECSNLSDYCGGTFQGLEGKLDYIQGMGFDAIWITPVINSRSSISHIIPEFFRV